MKRLAKGRYLQGYCRPNDRLAKFSEKMPHRFEKARTRRNGIFLLHGWKALGKTTPKQTEVRDELLSALVKSIAELGRAGFKCFDPRHAIRATHDGKSVDLVICFECGWVLVCIDGKAAARRPRESFVMRSFAKVSWRGLVQSAIHALVFPQVDRQNGTVAAVP
jgi:hypothetical protein